MEQFRNLIVQKVDEGVSPADALKHLSAKQVLVTDNRGSSAAIPCSSILDSIDKFIGLAEASENFSDVKALDEAFSGMGQELPRNPIVNVAHSVQTEQKEALSKGKEKIEAIASPTKESVEEPQLPHVAVIRQIANEYKNLANNLFKKNSFLKARDAYNEAIRTYMTPISFSSLPPALYSQIVAPTLQHTNLTVDPVLYLNRGFVSFKLGQFSDAVEDYSLALQGFNYPPPSSIPPGTTLQTSSLASTYSYNDQLNYLIKALWRRAGAYKELDDTRAALDDYTSVLTFVESVKEGTCIVTRKEVMDKIDMLLGVGIGDDFIDELREKTSFANGEKTPQVESVSPSRGPTTSIEKENVGLQSQDDGLVAQKTKNNITNKKPVAEEDLVRSLKKPQTKKPLDGSISRIDFEPESFKITETPDGSVVAIPSTFSKPKASSSLATVTQPKKASRIDPRPDFSPEAFEKQVKALMHEAMKNPFSSAAHAAIASAIEAHLASHIVAHKFVKLNGIDALANMKYFHSATALSHMKLMSLLFKTLDSDPIPDKLDPVLQIFPYLDHMILGILSAEDERLHTMLIKILSEDLLTNDQRIEVFYQDVKPFVGARLLKELDSLIFGSSSDIFKSCAAIIGRLFEFSPSFLGKKLDYNLKSFVTMVLYAFERNAGKCHLFYLSIVDMVDNIWKYIEMRKHTSLPIKGKKLHKDVHDLLTLMLDKCELFIGKISEEHRFLEEVFKTTACLLRLLNIRFEKANVWTPRWIRYSTTYPHLNVRCEAVRILGCLMKNNDDCLQQYLSEIPFVDLLNSFRGYFGHIDNEIMTCLFALLDHWIQTVKEAPASFEKNGGFTPLLAYMDDFKDRALVDYERSFGFVMYLCRTLTIFFQHGPSIKTLHEMGVTLRIFDLVMLFKNHEHFHRHLVPAIIFLENYDPAYHQLVSEIGEDRMKEMYV